MSVCLFVFCLCEQLYFFINCNFKHICQLLMVQGCWKKIFREDQSTNKILLSITTIFNPMFICPILQYLFDVCLFVCLSVQTNFLEVFAQTDKQIDKRTSQICLRSFICAWTILMTSVLISNFMNSNLPLPKGEGNAAEGGDFASTWKPT